MELCALVVSNYVISSASSESYRTANVVSIGEGQSEHSEIVIISETRLQELIWWGTLKSYWPFLSCGSLGLKNCPSQARVATAPC